MIFQLKTLRNCENTLKYYKVSFSFEYTFTFRLIPKTTKFRFMKDFYKFNQSY